MELTRLGGVERGELLVEGCFLLPLESGSATGFACPVAVVTVIVPFVLSVR